MQKLLLIFIALMALGLYVTVTVWPHGMHMTFSQHAATNRWSKLYYALLFTSLLPILLWFFIGWLVPAKGLPDSFIWFAGIAVIFQIACTWFPEVGGLKTTAHRILTAISGLAMLPLVVIIALLAHISQSVRIIAWIGLATMIGLLMIALANQRGFKYALLLQIGYYASFFLVLIVTTYA